MVKSPIRILILDIEKMQHLDFYTLGGFFIMENNFV